MDQKKKHRINKFAVLILLLILVPELVGHTIFDKPHPTSSSVKAAVDLTNKMDNGYPTDNFGCRLVIQSDNSSSNITRVAGLEGKYGAYDCSTNQN
ncbi:MAG: hypothetical protein KGI25_01715 [Thaumarchaeota archaeon]|nr:hypothetical protein [Nitrososphaerota archaeon]